MKLAVGAIVLLPVIICCPPPESIAPCSCKSDFGFSSDDILCSKLQNENDLRNVATACRNRKEIRIFSIQDSMFSYIIQDTFKGVKVQTLEIVRSSIGSLSDTDRAFEGLEEHLGAITIKDCTFLGDWMWEKLKHLSKLVSIELIGVELQSIDKDIEEISRFNIHRLNFDNNEIHYIHDNAFATFKLLLNLRLRNNKISVIRRNMLPKPAPLLSIIELSYNLIEELPPDLFTEMPSLEYFAVNHNKILTLNEKTFSPVWEQLKLMEAVGNAIRCDCRLSWITEKRRLTGLKTFCAEPQSLKGKDLRELTEKDLWC